MISIYKTWDNETLNNHIEETRTKMHDHRTHEERESAGFKLLVSRFVKMLVEQKDRKQPRRYWVGGQVDVEAILNDPKW